MVGSIMEGRANVDRKIRRTKTERQEAADRIVNMLRVIIAELADDPNDAEVSVQLQNESTYCIFNVRVEPKEMGKVLGKQGAHAMAMRQLVEASAAKNRLGRALLDISER